MTAPALRVPYITAWSGELITAPLMFAHHAEAGGPRLTYADPTLCDWQYGVLRARLGLQRGGRPEWKLVNTLRQWRCMEHWLCQVCGTSAIDPVTGRVSWLLDDDIDSTAPDQGYTNAPPTCRACIPEALASCPRLRRGAAAYTAADVEPFAVLGHVFRPTQGRGAEVVDRNVMVRLEEFDRLTRTLAHQLVVLLSGLERVPIRALT
ncbi:hypothetical protein [Nonomuraea dietziae]|uniref:hypothetical protein n=1 Tax=Nonomuraea dietziae TaxID=65515 RepID=UPI0034062E76